MAIRTLISVEEYLNTSFEGPGCEFFHGELLPRSMPPKPHSLIQAELAYIFRGWRAQHALFPMTEVRVRIAEDLIRIPDLAVWRGSIPPGDYPSDPAYAVVEILSPDDRMVALMEKLREYRAWGAAHIWVIDPVARTLHEFGTDGLRDTAAFHLPELGLTVSWNDVFRALEA